jgi:hypothetical protein
MYKIPDKSTLIQMLKAEEAERMGPAYAQACDQVAKEPNGWLRISEELQYSIAEQFGFYGFDSHIAVNHMRRAQYIYPDDPEFKTISVYVRANLSKPCDFTIGSNFPEILTVFTLDLEQVNLIDTFAKDKFNLLISSSAT